MQCRAKQQCNDERFRREAGCAASNGLQAVEAVVQRQERVAAEGATTIASSFAVSTVELISFAPMRASALVCRPRHFCTVVGLTPNRRARILALS